MAFRFLLLTILAVQSAAVRFGVDLANGKAHGQPPFKKSDRIAIVGAGPAGVHMASRLKQMGYTKTVLFERSDRVGGKSLTLYLNDTGECIQQKDKTGQMDTKSCVAHDMGTCFLHNGYHSIVDLVNEYNLTTTVAPEGRAMFSHFAKDSFSSQSMQEFVTSSIMDGVKKGTIKVPWYALTTKLKVLGALISAVKQYNILHESLLGKIEFSMPPRLNASTLQKINMTFAEFLENDLHALSGFLMFAHAAQGYGYVTSIPALYGLWWISPELLNGYVQMSFRQQLEKFADYTTKNKFGRICQSMRGCWVRGLVSWLIGGEAGAVKRTTTMLPEGYQKIWTTIAEKDGLDVRFGVDILEQGIDRQLASSSNTPIVIKYTQNGEQKTEEFQFLIYSGPHAHAKKYVKDLADQEQSIFSKLKSFVLATTLYASPPVKDYTDESHQLPIMYSADKMADSSQDGSWYADRYDDNIFAGVWNPTMQPRVGYQFYENYESDDSLKDTDRTPLRNKRMSLAPAVLHRFKQELAKQLVTNVTIIRQYPWPYFHHFEQEAIQEGMPWDLFEMQGERKTWWIGASACFESVHDVTNYNLMLLSKYMGAQFEAGRIV